MFGISGKKLKKTKLTMVISSLANKMDTTAWALLMAGLVLYWMSKLDAAKDKAKLDGDKPYLKDFFFDENIIEIPMSIVCCFILVLLGNDIPTSVFDFHSRGSTLLIGYASTSIVNGILSKRLLGKQPHSTIELFIVVCFLSQVFGNLLFTLTTAL